MRMYVPIQGDMMLDDNERKLLGILFNFKATRHRMPTMPELIRKSGRKRLDMYIVLRGLVEKEYILWPDNPKLETIVILQPWDPEQPTEREKNKLSSSSSVDYYLYY